MNIEITGCKDCLFSYSIYKSLQESNHYCLLSEKQITSGYLFINTENKNSGIETFRTDIPDNCPLPKEGITIKPKQ